MMPNKILNVDYEILTRSLINLMILAITGWAAHHWPYETIAICVQIAGFHAARAANKKCE